GGPPPPPCARGGGLGPHPPPARPRPPGASSSSHALRWGTIASPHASHAGAGRPAIGTRGRGGSGQAGGGPRGHGSRWSIAWRHGTCRGMARAHEPPRPRAAPRPSWGNAQPPPLRANGMPVGNATGVAASQASRSWSPRQKRWWSAPWACARGVGSMDTRMSFYHYLIETLEEDIRQGQLKTERHLIGSDMLVTER